MGSWDSWIDVEQWLVEKQVEVVVLCVASLLEYEEVEM